MRKLPLRQVFGVFAKLFGWVPLFGGFIVRLHMKQEFKHTFGVAWWQYGAKDKAAEVLKDLDHKTGASHEYAHSRQVAQYFNYLPN